MKSMSHRVSAKHKSQLRRANYEKKSQLYREVMNATLNVARIVEDKFCTMFPCLGYLVNASKLISIFTKINEFQDEEDATTAECTDNQQEAATDLDNREKAPVQDAVAHNDASPPNDTTDSTYPVTAIASAVASVTENTCYPDTLSAVLNYEVVNNSKATQTPENDDTLSAADANDPSTYANDVANNEIDEEEDTDLDIAEYAAQVYTFDQATTSKDGYVVLKRTIPDFKDSITAMIQFVNASQTDKKDLYA